MAGEQSYKRILKKWVYKKKQMVLLETWNSNQWQCSRKMREYKISWGTNCFEVKKSHRETEGPFVPVNWHSKLYSRKIITMLKVDQGHSWVQERVEVRDSKTSVENYKNSTVCIFLIGYYGLCEDKRLANVC